MKTQADLLKRLVGLGKQKRQHQRKREERIAQEIKRKRDRHFKLMTSPFGRWIVMVEHSSFSLRLLLIPIFLIGIFLENSIVANGLEHLLKSLPSLKGYDIESITVLILIISPLVGIVALYFVFKYISERTVDFYYGREKIWKESLPFLTDGYWEFLSQDQHTLEVTIAYQNELPPEERMANIVSGLGFDHTRSTELSEKYDEANDEAEVERDREHYRIVIDRISMNPQYGGLKNMLVKGRGTPRGVIYVRKKLHLIINNCLLPLHTEFPIAGIKIGH